MKNDDENKFDYLRKHADTVVILAGILGATMWMTSKMNDVEKDIAIIKTVLVMKNIMPEKLAQCDKKGE
jgi:hypothetical protein